MSSSVAEGRQLLAGQAVDRVAARHRRASSAASLASFTHLFDRLAEIRRDESRVGVGRYRDHLQRIHARRRSAPPASWPRRAPRMLSGESLYADADLGDRRWVPGIAARGDRHRAGGSVERARACRRRASPDPRRCGWMEPTTSRSASCSSACVCRPPPGAQPPTMLTSSALSLRRHAPARAASRRPRAPPPTRPG